MDIRLNFINDSNDTHNTQVLIFSQNVTPGPGDASAWTVIRNCAPGSNHPFVYPMATMIGYLDSYGNYTQRLPAEPGQRFEAVFTNAGDAIQAKGTAATPRAIELANTLREGTITAQLFKDGRLYASAPAIAPGGLAEFVLEPSIWIGTLSQRSAEDSPVSITMGQDNSEISLLGIASADIVMTGGDPDPFRFTLQNVVVA